MSESICDSSLRSDPSSGEPRVEDFDGAADLVRAWFRGLAPDPQLTVSAWADRHRILSARAANEAGPWRTARAPYLRDVMDALSPSHPAQRVVIMKGAQIGATEAGNNWIGYVIHHTPGPMLAVQPTVDLAKRFSKQRIDPLIEDTPALRQFVAPARARDSGNTVLSKEFPGGILMMTGANSAVGLRSMPVRYLFLDEVDAYPQSVDEEGDPIALAEARTRTFSWRRKMFLVSTPTIKDASRIEREYQASDQRRFFVPCPHCGDLQWLKFEQLHWDKGRPETAHYVCEHCGAVIEERYKTQMLEAGEWRPTATSVDPLTIGFHLSALYSPLGWYGWAQIARDWEAAENDDDAKRTFANTVLGDTWEEHGEAPAIDMLMLRREDYPLQRVPSGGLVLTAGVDVQKDYLQYEVVAWGPGRESWSLDLGIINGDTASQPVWQELQRLLARTYPDECGTERPIAMMAVDSGYNTAWVYDFTRRHLQAMAVKGVGDSRTGHLAPALGTETKREVAFDGKRAKRGASVWPMGDWVLKSELYANLEKPGRKDGAAENPPGYCHFSTAHDREFFQQLTAERLVTRTVRGRQVREWVLRPGSKNEALDCRKMAMAAAIRLQLWTLDDAGWRSLGATLGAPAAPVQGELPLAGVVPPTVPPTPTSPPTPTVLPGRTRRIRSTGVAA